MALEIEHKYIVVSDEYKSIAEKSIHIRQGYLSDDKQRTVRVRMFGDKAFLTIKGQNVGAVRAEYEYEIPVADAEAMLNTLCKKPIIDKTRHIVPYEGNRWEIDEFAGQLSGLTLAEIELPSEDYSYPLPPFVGKNVTDDPRYYNSVLSASGEIPK